MVGFVGVHVGQLYRRLSPDGVGQRPRVAPMLDLMVFSGSRFLEGNFPFLTAVFSLIQLSDNLAPSLPPFSSQLVKHFSTRS